MSRSSSEALNAQLCFSEADAGYASDRTGSIGSAPTHFHAVDFFNEAFGGKEKKLGDRLRGGLGLNVSSRPH